MITDRTYRHVYSRQCAHCTKPYDTWNKASLYCSERCRTDAATARRDRSNIGHWKTTPRTCPMCSTEFLPPSAVRRYCSGPCQAKARRADWDRFKRENPEAQIMYNRTRGRDTLIVRVRKRYPDLPAVCEAVDCHESRVLELAHKPEHKRNGGWRTMDRYERHMFWVLCPTCHRLLDQGIETPEQMGLR